MFIQQENPSGIRPGTHFRHYKGGEYEYVGEATHSETKEALVVYRALYGEGVMWARPKEMFYDTVTVDGTKKPRFARIG